MINSFLLLLCAANTASVPDNHGFVIRRLIHNPFVGCVGFRVAYRFILITKSPYGVSAVTRRVYAVKMRVIQIKTCKSFIAHGAFIFCNRLLMLHGFVVPHRIVMNNFSDGCPSVPVCTGVGIYAPARSSTALRRFRRRRGGRRVPDRCACICSRVARTARIAACCGLRGIFVDRICTYLCILLRFNYSFCSYFI